MEEKQEDQCQKCEEYLNGWKRAAADLANYKKDEARRFEDFAKISNAFLIAALLPVLDSFERSGNSPAGESPVRTQLEDILKKAGLERLEVKVGDVFNPAIHEAVESLEGSLEGNLPNTIAEVVEVGYNLHGKLLRPAKVKVWQKS